MAQIADAYVEINPDLTGFATELHAKLAGIDATINVPVVPQLKGFDPRGLSQQSEVLAERITEAVEQLSPVAGQVFAQKFANAINQNISEQMNAPFKTLHDETSMATRWAIEDAVEEARNTFRQHKDGLVPKDVQRSFEHQLTTMFGPAGGRAARAMFLDIKREADKAAALAERERKQAANKAEREARDLAKRLGKVTGSSMVNALTEQTHKVTEVLTAWIVPFRLKRGIRGVIGAFSTMAQSIAASGVRAGELFAKGLVAAAPIITDVFELMVGVVAKADTEAAKDVAAFGAQFAKTIGNVGLGLAELLPQLAQWATPIGAIVGALIAVAVAGAALVGVAALIQTALAGVLVVVVPLIAAVYSLVGAFVELGTVGVGAILALPGAIATVGGAIGVLGLAWDKFNNELQKSGEGPLHDLKGHLENAIFAAIGFDDIIKQLATQTLPKLLPGISQVAVAWGKVFGEIAKLLQSKVILDAITSSFADMAAFVKQLVPLIRPLATIFITLSQTAQPAITAIVASIAQLVGWLAQFFTQLAKSGQLQQIFAVIGQSITMLVGLVPGLLQIFVGFFKVAGPGFVQLLAVIGAFVDQFNAFINSAQGQQVLTEFFGSVNSMMSNLLPLVTVFMTAIANLGPVFAQLMEAVRPIIEQLVPVLVQMVQSALPGILAFLGQIQGVMADKAVQGAIVQLGQAFGQLIGQLAMFDPRTTAEFVIVLTDIVGALASMVMIIGPLVRYLVTLAAAIGAAVEAFGRWVGSLFAAKGSAEGFGHTLKLVTDMFIALIKTIPGAGFLLKNLDSKLEATRNVMNQTATAGANIGYGVESGLVDAYNSGYWDKLAGKALSLAQIFDKLFEAHGGQNIANVNWRALAAEVGQYTAGVKEASKALGAKVKAPAMDPKFAKGFAQSLTDPKKAKAAAGHIVDTVKEALGRLDSKKLTGKAYDSAREIATWIAKGVLSGSRLVNKAVEAMLANKSIKKNLDALARNVVARDKLIANIKAQQKALADLIQEKAQFRDALAQTLMTARDIANRWTFAPDPEDVKEALAFSLDEVRKFIADLNTLAKKGFSRGLVAQLAAAGVAGGGAMAAGLATATPKQVKEISTLFDQIGTTASASADQVAASLYDPGIATIQGYIKGLQSQQAKLDAQIAKQVGGVVTQSKKILGIKSPSTVFQGMGADSLAGFVVGLGSTYKGMTFSRWATQIFVDPMYQIGKDLVDGLVLGIENRQWWLRRTLTNMATSIVAAVRQALGIKSPSTVFRDIGIDTVLGYVQGLAAGQPLVQSQLNEIGGLRPSYAGAGAFGGVGAGTPNVGVQVFIGDKELTQIIDSRVTVNDEASARALVLGRRVR